MQTSSSGQRSGTDALATRQVGLFVLWPKSRGSQRRILTDLRERFVLRKVFEVHWTPRRVRSNYERFYSDLEVRGVYHLLNKGSGPFLAAIVEDCSPALEPRMTSRGRRTVNARFVDAKSQYRGWMGGLEVHCGETDWETQRDLSMLLGQQLRDRLLEDQPDWDDRIEVLHRDVSGAEGWSSAGEMFGALGDGVDYVLLDGAESAATAFVSGGAQPQILAGQYHTAHTVLGARALRGSPSPRGGRFAVRVGGRRFVFGLRRVGDGFLDEEFASRCLERRVLDRRGFYCLAPDDALAVSAYRTLYHSPKPDAQQAQVLLDTNGRSQVPRPVQPRDPSVYFDPSGGQVGLPAGLLDGLRRIGVTTASTAGGLGRYYYLKARDRLVLAAPWLRRLRALLRRVVR